MPPITLYLKTEEMDGLKIFRDVNHYTMSKAARVLLREGLKACGIK